MLSPARPTAALLQCRPSSASKIKIAAAKDPLQRTIVFKSFFTLSGSFSGPVDITVSGESGPPNPAAPVAGEKRKRDSADTDGSDDGGNVDEDGSDEDSSDSGAQGIDLLLRDRGVLSGGSMAFLFDHSESGPVSGKKLLPIRKSTYTQEQKVACVGIYNAKRSFRGAVREINKWPGYERVDRRILKRWVKLGVEKKPRSGRGVNAEFERAVLGQLIFTVLTKQTDGSKEDTARVIANVAYSFEIIRLAAQSLVSLEPWCSDASVKKLKFSDMWIKGFLKRATMRRRRVTGTVKQIPEVPVVQARMRQIQEAITRGPAECQPDGSKVYQLGDVVNADETASRYAAMPTYQYVMPGADRGVAPEFDESARFTTMLGGAANGVMLPSFNIIKCTVDRPDL